MDKEQKMPEAFGLKTTYFRIASHLIAVLHDDRVDLATLLPNFEPFGVAPFFHEELILTVILSSDFAPESKEDAILLSDISVWNGENFSFAESLDSYMTIMENVQSQTVWQMISTKDFSHSVIYTGGNSIYSGSKLSWLIMVAYGQAVLSHRTILIHASVIENAGVGYAFLGKSGTGKSTHSRLWLTHVEGSRLINDDNPVVRIYENEGMFIYGTPWSGKTKCYINRTVKLGAIVRLAQAPVNHFQKRKGREAFVTLLPSVSALRWNTKLFDAMLASIEEIAGRTTIGYLECLPDAEAALLCHRNISDEHLSISR